MNDGHVYFTDKKGYANISAFKDYDVSMLLLLF